MTEPKRKRLAPPEHLDRVLQATTAKAWLALLVLMAAISALVAWAVVGEISTYVRADGILLSRGGRVVDATTFNGGMLSRIVPAVGDAVEEGQVVAEVFNPGTMERYTGALALAKEHARALRDREAEERGENALVEQSVAQQRALLEELERTGRQLVETALDLLRDHRALFEQDLVEHATVEQDERALDHARRNLFDVMRRRDELETRDLRRRNDLRERIAQASADRVEAENRVKEIAAVIEAWRIRAPVSGRVTEIKAQVGSTLEPGQSVLSVETGRRGMDVLIYVPSTDGKRVAAGMPALVSPTIVHREEFGSMQGRVESISEFPASLAGMTAVLGNEELARSFSWSGPPYPGRVTLKPDPSTESGFAWTTSRAAAVSVTPGTLATIEIKVKSQPPIELVVPLLKEALNL